ncbi:MAG: hypothetical protein ACXWN4_01195 [Candidatus Limnocylindrales bacterium]
MSMIHRMGLTISVVVALLVMVGVFVVQGYMGAQADAAQAAAQTAAEQTAAEATPSPTATVEPLTIYIEPAPTPPPAKKAYVAPPVVVPKPQPAQVQPPPVPEPPQPPQTTKPKATPPVIHIIVTPSPGHGEDGGGGGDN